MRILVVDDHEVVRRGVASLLGQNDPNIAKEVQDSEQLVQQLNKEIRTMSYLLHPPLLDENGLVEAVRWYVQGLKERSGLDIEMNVSGDEFGRLPHEMELALFRIVQECLTNVHRHSGSKTATIRMERAADGVGVEVEDQGKGIPAEKLDGSNNIRSGVGIAGIQERVRHFRGTVQIESSARGTKVSVRMPNPAMDVRASDGEIPERAAV
jgi:signal transduction histidine kinase